MSIYYHGGNNPNNWKGYIWISEDENYASEYGNLYKLQINDNKLNLADEFELEDLFDDDFPLQDAMYNPDDEFINIIKQNQYNGFYIDVNGQNYICIFDKSLIKRIQEIKK